MSESRRKNIRKMIAVVLSVVLLCSVVPYNLIWGLASDKKNNDSTEIIATESEANPLGDSPEYDPNPNIEPEEEDIPDDEPDDDDDLNDDVDPSEEEESNPDEIEKYELTIKVIAEGEEIPLEGAVVEIDGVEYSEKTNEGGSLVIADLEKDKQYSFHFECKGFNPYDCEYVITGENDLLEVRLPRKETIQSIINITSEDEISLTTECNDSVVEIRKEENSYIVYYYVGETAQIKFIPDNTAKYDSQTIDCTDGENKDVNFEIKTYSITVNGDILEENIPYGKEYQIDIPDEADFTVKAKLKIGDDAEKDVDIGEDHQLVFTVEGNTSVTYKYIYGVFVEMAGEGTAKCVINDKETTSAEIDKNATANIEITPDYGYEIETIYVDDEDRGTEPTIEVTAKSNIVVKLKPIEYTLTVKLVNTENNGGSAELAIGTKTLTLNKDDESATVNVPVKFDGEGWTVDIEKVSCDEHYEIKDFVTQKSFTSNDSLTLELEANEYTISFKNPFGEIEDITGTVESDDIVLPTPTQEGFTFLGWTESSEAEGIVSDEGLIKNIASGELKENKTLYAIYTIDKLNDSDIMAKANVPVDSFTEGYEGSDFDYATFTAADFYFADDVVFTLPESVGDIIFTCVDGEESSEITAVEGAYKVLKSENEIAITVSQKKTFEDDDFKGITYVSAESNEFTIRFDYDNPELEVKDDSSLLDGDNKVKDTVASSDAKSGIAKTEYTVIDVTTNTYNNLLIPGEKDYTSLKNSLRKESWNAYTEGEEIEITDSQYVVYRTVDNAGNDVYSVFDRTEPTVEIKTVEVNNSTAWSSLGKKDVLTNVNVDEGKIVVDVIVKDKKFAYKYEGYEYTGATLEILNGTETLGTIDFTDADERFSITKDKIEFVFVIPANADYCNKLLTFRVNVEDQCGNEGFANFENRFLIEDEVPAIGIEYSEFDGSSNDNTIWTKSDSVTAKFTASSTFFNLEDKGNFEADDVSFDADVTKTETSAYGEYTFTQDGAVTVNATTTAGTTNSATTKNVVFDTTEPVVTVESVCDSIVNEGNIVIGKDGMTLKVTVTDDNLSPIKTNVSIKIYKDGVDYKDAVITNITDSATEYVDQIYLKDEGEYTVVVKAIDAANNTNNGTEYDGFFVDKTAPVISEVIVEKKKSLKFGNYFLKNVVEVSAVVEDFPAGVQSVKLVIDNDTIVDMEYEDGKYSCVYSIDDSNDGWKKGLKIALTDNVANSKTYTIKDLLELDTNTWIYETNAPSVTSDATNVKDSKVLYKGANGDLWLYKDASFKIDITDLKCEGFDSGLYNISITNNGKAIAGDSDISVETAVLDKSYTFDYNTFSEGKNVITVTATDNAENEKVISYTIYKDIDAPTVQGITFGSNGNNLAGYSYANGNITATVYVGDSEFTSGIKSVTATYVTSSKSYPCTAVSVPAATDKTSGANEYVAYIFDVPYKKGTTGYISVSISDNAGNTAKFNNKSDIAKLDADYTNIKVNKIMFEANGIVITNTIGKDNIYSGKWMYDNKSFDINFTDKNGKINSGIYKIKVVNTSDDDAILLNKTEKENTLTDKFTVTYDMLVEGENIIKVTAYDNAGTKTTATYTVYKDVKAPSPVSVYFSESEQSVLSKIVNTLTFGNFFNEKVNITLVYDDPDSGVRDVTLYFADGTSVTNTTPARTEGTTKFYTFELPESDKTAMESFENDVEYWASVLSVNAVDNTGNASEITEIAKLGVSDNNGQPTASDVYFEQVKPTISSALENKKSTSEVYYDVATKTYWVMDKSNIKIYVADESAPLGVEKNSGLGTVTVLLNKESYAGNDFSVGTVKTTNASYVVNFDDLVPGINTIKVVAVDNCNNSYTETYYVYKDENAPVIDMLSLTGKDTQILKTGNFYNDQEDVVLTVNFSDAQYSAGIASVEAWFVSNLDESETKLTLDNSKIDEKQAVEEIAVKDGKITAERTFTIKAADFMNADGSLKVIITDNTGKQFVYPDSDTNTSYSFNRIMFESVAPEITYTTSTCDYECTCEDCRSENGLPKQWFFSDDIEVTLLVSDETNDAGTNSGINSVTVKLNDTKIVGDTIFGKALRDEDELDTNSIVTKQTFTFNLKDFAAVIDENNESIVKDGENVIVIDVADSAGNVMETETYYVYIDEKSPEVVNIALSGTDGEDSTYSVYNTSDEGSELVYGYYFKSETTASVEVRDEIATSGVKTIVFKTVAAEDSKVGGFENQTAIDNICIAEVVQVEATETEEAYEITEDTAVADFTIPAGFKGQIYAYVIDNAGHNSLSGDKDVSKVENWYSPNGTVLETQTQHDAHDGGNHVKLTSVTEPVGFGEGNNPLYSGDVTLNVVVTDSFNGIEYIDVTLASDYDTSYNFSERYTFDDNGQSANGANVNNWSVEYSDNLIVRAERNYVVSNDCNDIMFTVVLTDRSGNKTTDYYVFNIDKTAPIINVTFEPADGGDDGEFTGYFNCDRNLTVTVHDSNLVTDDINIVCTADGSAYSVGGFSKGGMDENGRYVYTLTHTFHNDADYTFAISASDLAGYSTSDNEVNYGTEGARTVAKEFTIDETAPVIEVSMTSTNIKDEYYNEQAIVTVTITEHNWTEGRYTFEYSSVDSLTGTADGGTYTSVSNGDNGDTHTYTYTFDTEHRFAITGITVTDMAGNETDTFSNDNQHLVEGFVIDKTDPVVKFRVSSDSDTSLNSYATAEESFAPVITIQDTNIDGSDIHVTVTKEYGIELDEETLYNINYTTGTDTATVDFIDFPVEEQYDGIYYVEVTAYDMAGRSSDTSETYARFSVNRFGATFMLSPESKEYVAEDSRWHNDEGLEDIVVYEINAAPIKSYEITYTKGITKETLSEGSGYTVAKQTPTDGGTTNWYMNTYTIKKDTFIGKDGTYSIEIMSEDEAVRDDTTSGVVSYSSTSERVEKIDEENADRVYVSEKEGSKLDTPIIFVVDNESPTVLFNNLDNDNYNEAEHKFTFSVMDNEALAEVKFYVDGEEVKITAETDEVTTNKSNGDLVREGKNTANMISTEAYERMLNGEVINWQTDENKHSYAIVAVDKAGNSNFEPEDSSLTPAAAIADSKEYSELLALICPVDENGEAIPYIYSAGNTLAYLSHEAWFWIVVSLVVVGGVTLALVIAKRKKEDKADAAS